MSFILGLSEQSLSSKNPTDSLFCKENDKLKTPGFGSSFGTFLGGYGRGFGTVV